MKIIYLLARIFIAVFLLQTLYYKFTGHADSIHIFSSLGAEPVGRIGSGIVELIASILLLIPKTVWIGALMAMGTMAGAIMAHVFVIGIEVNGDNGSLFYAAVGIFFLCLIILYRDRKKVPILSKL